MTNEGILVKALDTIDDGFFVISPTWQITYINAAFERITGTTRDQIIGKDFFSVFPIDDRYQYHTYYRQAMETQKSIRFEEFSHELNRWYLISVFPSDSGLSVYFKDIHDRKEQELRLRESENKLRAILNSTADANILISPESKILSFNKAAHDRCIQKHGKNMMIGDSFFDYVFNDDRHIVEAALLETRNNRMYSYETTVQDKAEKTYHMLVFYYPVHDDNGQFVGSACNAIDITQTTQKEVALQEIARMQAHDMRRPVASILGIVNLLKRETHTGETVTLIQMLERSTQELDKVIHRIIDKALNETL